MITSGKPGVPAVALTGEIAVMLDAGSVDAEIVKGTEFEATPEFVTVIEAVPADAISAAEISAVSCVALTNVVARAELFQLTTEPLTKFVPVTVRVNPLTLHDATEFACVVEDVAEVTVGAAIVNGVCPEVPPPGVIVKTWTCVVPAARKSAAGTVAVNCDALT